MHLKSGSLQHGYAHNWDIGARKPEKLFSQIASVFSWNRAFSSRRVPRFSRASVPSPERSRGLLQTFTVAGLMPAALTMRSRSAGKSLFVAEFPGLEPARACFLVAKLSGMPCVRRARMSIAKDRMGATGVGCASWTAGDAGNDESRTRPRSWMKEALLLQMWIMTSKVRSSWHPIPFRFQRTVRCWRHVGGAKRPR